jgi:hypothetical protein
MPEPLVRSESPIEYFRELVESALQHQHLEVRALTSYYLVSLLNGFVHREYSAMANDEALGVRFVRALGAAGTAQRNGLRQVGDTSLFISGVFADSLNGTLVDIDYYMHLGEQAYGSLARRDEALGEVFDELAEKFSAMVDVLTEVSEQAGLNVTNVDTLRLYEKWLRTGSRRNGQRLAAKGIVPSAATLSRFVQ